MNAKKLDFLKSLVYLDAAFVADFFEVFTGESPDTQISRNQGKKAGASLLPFSAEISAQETRSYKFSTNVMLEKIMEEIESYPILSSKSFAPKMPSQFGWVNGELTVFRVGSTRLTPETGETNELDHDLLYQIKSSSECSLALITTPEYFSSGFEAFVRLQKTLLKEMLVPVRAFVRVTAARDYTNQWIAIPYLITERNI